MYVAICVSSSVHSHNADAVACDRAAHHTPQTQVQRSARRWHACDVVCLGVDRICVSILVSSRVHSQRVDYCRLRPRRTSDTTCASSSIFRRWHACDGVCVGAGHSGVFHLCFLKRTFPERRYDRLRPRRSSGNAYASSSILRR